MQKVHEPYIRALLGSTSHVCEVVVLRSRTLPNCLMFKSTLPTRCPSSLGLIQFDLRLEFDLNWFALCISKNYIHTRTDWSMDLGVKMDPTDEVCPPSNLPYLFDLRSFAFYISTIYKYALYPLHTVE